MIASRYLDEVGDGSGNINLGVDASTTAREFLIKPNSNEILKITRLVVFLRDAGSIDSGAYGNGIVLSNGIELFVRRRGADGLSDVRLWDVTAQKKIITNPDWSALCFDTAISTYGSGSETLSARYTFTKEANNGILLDGANGEELVCRINDDLSNLVEHTIRAGIDKK